MNKPFPSITPSQLMQQIEHNSNSTLILDIRPQTAYNQAHLKHSINFNLPTTLLKRPLYGADKIQSSLPSCEQRERFDRYKTALPLSSVPTDSQLNQILVLDHHSCATHPNHPLTLVLNKFRSVGFQGSLVWLDGGFQALLDSLSRRSDSDWSARFIDCTQNSTSTSTSTATSTSTSSNPSSPENPLRMSFSIPPLSLNASLPTPPANPSSSSSQTPLYASSASSHPPSSTPKSNPRRIQMTLGMLLPHTPSSDSSPFHSSSSSTSRLNRPPNSIATSSAFKSSLSTSPPPNPFFDNIRQLNERLSLSGSLQHLSPIDLPTLSNPSRDLPRLPLFLGRLFQDSPQGRAKRLAHEFHDLEMAEQLRLQDVMRWESSRGYSMLPALESSENSLPRSSPQPLKLDHQQSHHDPNYHPFSISAGVELGYKNRYKNIWPYEHARIRLRGGPGRRNDSDYVNASMINFRSDGAPSGLEVSKVGGKKYIATQGPLTSTFEDFWSVVVEEDVGLIIMITRRHEAGREKCADYVRNGQYGETVVSVNHHPEQNAGIESDSDEERDQVTGFFGFTEAQFTNHNDHDQTSTSKSNNHHHEPSTSDRKKGGILFKTIHLSRATRPDLPPRKIAHIQYRGWPDFDVPPAAEEVLELIRRSHQASEEMVKLNDQAIDEYVQNSNKNSSNKAEDRSEIERIVGRGSGPVIVHCSAGVGRTGSFILLDVMIDVLKAQYLSPKRDVVIRPTVSETNSKNPPPSETPFKSPLNHSSTTKSSSLPKFLNSQLCDCLSDVAPIWQKFPIMPVVDEMREQRMSMVANYRQYVFLHEVLIKFMINELKIPIAKTTMTPSTSQTELKQDEEEEEIVIATSFNLASTSNNSNTLLNPPVSIKLPPSPQSINNQKKNS